MLTTKVGIIHRETYEYPKEQSLFRPSIEYPEFKGKNIGITQEQNNVFDMVRESLHIIGLDNEHYNSLEWNPLGDGLIKPGDTVLLKPNLVMDNNPCNDNTDCLYTNPSVVAAIIEYVLLALKGNGAIIVGDAPMQECNFEKLIKDSGYEKLISYLNQRNNTVSISLADFRDLKTTVINKQYHQKLTGHSKGITVQLNEDSEFWGLAEQQYKNLRITNYGRSYMEKHHNTKVSEYYICGDVLSADVIINLPKPKTHRKAGVTIALKNLVGVNSRKEYLPHHTQGSVEEGGDEYLKKQNLKHSISKLYDLRNTQIETGRFIGAKVTTQVIRVLSIFNKFLEKDEYKEGSWYGNDTIAKTITDLNKIILYADKNGRMTDHKQRKYLTIADMIVSGEGEGPVMPSAKNVGIIAISLNAVAMDLIIATIMGADVTRIPTLLHSMHPRGRYSLVDYDSITTVSNDPRWDKMDLSRISPNSILHFKPSSGWKTVFKPK